MMPVTPSTSFYSGVSTSTEVQSDKRATLFLSFPAPPPGLSSPITWMERKAEARATGQKKAARKHRTTSVATQTQAESVVKPAVVRESDNTFHSNNSDDGSLYGVDGVDWSSLSSVGAIGHAAGTCRPCAWHWRPQGCQNGFECKFCHSCTDGTLKRKRYAKTLFLKIAQRYNITVSADGDKFQF
eukprot:TRINITY_DN45470_c0_g1_i1.p1 TRINITY_DN45470_c0_g1~~TRINITY_DN45470_c0_g1_i1.p1  ORF type:complete len:185 (-),score=25.88 TRINITY_DN45470_c0_g1_i1:34-588(-)